MANEKELLAYIAKKVFREKTMSVDRVSPSGTTPLHTVAMIPASRKSARYAKRLIKMGASIDAVCNEGRTPASYTIPSGNHKVLKELLLRGAVMTREDYMVAQKLENKRINKTLFKYYDGDYVSKRD